MRTYTARQCRRRLASVSLLEVDDTYDFRRDIGHPFVVNYEMAHGVFVLRRYLPSQSLFAELNLFASPSALRPHRPSSEYLGIRQSPCITSSKKFARLKACEDQSNALAPNHPRYSFPPWLKEVADPCGSALQRSVLSDKRAREGNALREMKTGHQS